MKNINKILLITIITLCCLLLGCSKKENDDVITTKKESTDVITISSKNPSPILYDKNGIQVSMEQCEYTEGKTDIRITLGIKNESNNAVNIDFSNFTVDDANISSVFDVEPYKSGTNVSSCYYFSKEDLEIAKVTNFDKVNCVLTITSNDKELCNQNLIIQRDRFTEYPEYSSDNSDETYEEQNQITSLVYNSYIEAKEIDESNIEQSEYKTTYHGISINQDELDWLEDGAVYRALAKKVEGFYMEFSKSN